MVMRPLDPQELLDASDIAGEAIVKKVTHDARGRPIAQLRFTRLRKGFWKLWFCRTVNVAMRGDDTSSTGEVILGSWTDGYASGTRVFTHLVWDDEDKAYRTTHWNAVRELGPA
jgi:hypothetical protein